MPVSKMIAVMNRQNAAIPGAIAKQSRNIEKAIGRIERAYKEGRRVYFVGAGTSGRLGVLEAAELPPTFNVAPDRFQALMAGGSGAVFHSKEGAEDDPAAVRSYLSKNLRAGDVVIGIAASGVTAYVQSALQTARRKRAGAVLLTCNPQSPLRRYADVSIALDTGPELISGSTRLKAGSATKMVLNMLTTLAMVRCGKTYRNRMVDVQIKSRKLEERALRLAQELGGATRETARKALRESSGNAKTAIVMLRKNISRAEALRRLKKAAGFLAKSLA